MKTTLKLLAGASGIAYAALGTTGALATGTTSGTSITNQASVAYSVGGVAQTPATGSVTFTVDRKVTVVVAESGTTATTVVPGQVNVATAFVVTNSSNAPIDIGLSVNQVATGTATAHSGAALDAFDVTGIALYVDTNTNGIYDAGTDTAITGNYFDELAADAVRNVLVVATIPAAAANGQYAGVQLVAQARESGAAGTQGVVITATAGANTAGVDTVLLDAVGPATGDAANDGEASDDDDYLVSSATLTVTKSSRIVSDPVNGTTNPKNIPGATLEFCINVANTGAAAATSVTVTDTLQNVAGSVNADRLLYTAGSTYLNATVTGGVCNNDGTLGGTYAAGPPEVIGGNLGTINAGANTALRFRATIK